MRNVQKYMYCRIDTELVKIRYQLPFNIDFQLAEEQMLTKSTWRLPTIITLTVLGGILLLLVLYITIHHVRLRRAILTNEWRVAFHDIHVTEWLVGHHILQPHQRPRFDSQHGVVFITKYT